MSRRGIWPSPLAEAFELAAAFRPRTQQPSRSWSGSLLSARKAFKAEGAVTVLPCVARVQGGGPVPLLSACVVSIHFVHLERSVVLHISQSTVHCFCDRGKQASKSSMPAHFSNGWPGGRQRTQSCQNTAEAGGVIFAHFGHAWAGQSAAHRYACAKYTLSVRAKHTILSCARGLQGYRSWGKILEVRQECADMAADGMAEALRLDCVRVWEGVTFLKKTQCSFRPSALRLRKVVQRARVERVDKMLPVTIGAVSCAAVLQMQERRSL